MAFENLKRKHFELTDFLMAHGYSATVIREVSRVINTILDNFEDMQWSTYRDVYRYYEGSCSSKDILRSRRYCLRMIRRFDEQGAFPDRTRGSYVFEKDEYISLSEEFRGLIDFYRKHETEHGKKETTVYREAVNAVSFLCHLKDRGLTRLEDVAENDVVSFFLSENGEQLRGCSYKKNVSADLKAGTYWKKEACNKILLLLPAFREARKTIQYLTGDEVQMIADALATEGSGLSLRDRAVGCLLLYTGMRGCDIACLLMESVDWNGDQIRITQRKTGIPLELPLTPTVGNAIYDYLDSERPASVDSHVFLSEIMPHRPLSSQGIGNISSRIFKAAGIRQEPGVRKGTHIFRHHAASAMLENGIPQPVISRVFGHTAPDSLEPYLMADFRHLRECAIGVEDLPVPEEVLPL